MVTAADHVLGVQANSLSGFSPRYWGCLLCLAKCHSPGAIPLAVRDGDGEVGLSLHPSYSVSCRYAFQSDDDLLINLSSCQEEEDFTD